MNDRDIGRDLLISVYTLSFEAILMYIFLEVKYSGYWIQLRWSFCYGREVTPRQTTNTPERGKESKILLCHTSGLAPSRTGCPNTRGVGFISF